MYTALTYVTIITHFTMFKLSYHADYMDTG